MRAGEHQRESTPGQKTRAQLARHLGTVARAARQELGLTQEEVAERLGVAAEVYARIERGRALPRVTNLRNLCRVLRVDAGALLGTARAGESALPLECRVEGCRGQCLSLEGRQRAGARGTPPRARPWPRPAPGFWRW